MWARSVCDFETKYITEENSKVSNIKYHIYKGNVSNKKYDNLQIRAKVIINNEVYYVDKNGVALVNEEYIEINVPEFEKFIHKNALYEHRNRYNNDGCKYHE